MLIQRTLRSIPAQAGRNAPVGTRRGCDCPEGAEGIWGVCRLGKGMYTVVGVMAGGLRRFALTAAAMLAAGGTAFAQDVSVTFDAATMDIPERQSADPTVGVGLTYGRAVGTDDPILTIMVEPVTGTGATGDDLSLDISSRIVHNTDDYTVDNWYDFTPVGDSTTDILPIHAVLDDEMETGDQFDLSIVIGGGLNDEAGDSNSYPDGSNNWAAGAVTTVRITIVEEAAMETVDPIIVTLPGMVLTGTEGTTVTVPITLSRGFDGTSGDQFTVQVTALGGSGLQEGAAAGDYVIDVGTEGYVNHAGDGEVHFLPPNGVTEMNLTLELRDDSLWELGESIRITFDMDDPLWDNVFEAGTPNSVDVNIMESTTRPTLGMAASAPGVTESTGGGVTTANFYWTDNWPDVAPSVGAGSVGKIPDTHKVRYTVTGTATRAADSSSGDYYISGPTSFSPLSAVLEHNIQSTQPGGDQSLPAPRTTITVNDTAGDQGERTVIVTGQLLDPGGNVVPGFESFGPVTITINDHLIVTLTSVAATVIESNTGEADVDTTWRVALNAAPAAALNLQVTKTGSLADDEYTLPMNQFVSFAAATGDTSQDITVPVTGDDILEENETLTLAIDSAATGFPSVATVVSNAASARTVTINDNDTTAFTVERVGTGEVTDGSDVTFRVTMSGAIEPSIDLMWQVQSGGDTSPQDFNLNVTSFPNGTVTFPANSAAGTTRDFTVSVMDFAGSGDGESAEEFTVGLSIPGSNYGGRATIGTPGTASATIAQDPRILVTLTATPSSIAEGEGVVDVRITASVPANISGDGISITLSPTSTGTANEDDFTLVGHVVNAGTSTETQMMGMPTITIDSGSMTSAMHYLQLEVPTGVANEAAEELVFAATVSGNILYATASELTIAIPTTQPVADESRIARKQFRLAANGPEVLTWGVDVRIGSASSRNYSIGSETRRLSRVDAFVDGSIVRFEFDQKLPDDTNKIMRVTTGGVTTALDFGDVTESLPIDSDYPDREWVYGWDSTRTLPTITLNTWFTAELIHRDVNPAFEMGASIANPEWHRDTMLTLALPSVVAGNAPIDYMLDGTLPAGTGFYEDGDSLPSGVTYEGARPVILGTPTEELPIETFTYTAQDADGAEVELTFMAGVATLPPTSLGLTRGQNSFTLSWTAPVIANNAVSISGYKIERAIGTADFSELVASHPTINYPDTDSALASEAVGTAVKYRVSAISNGGTSAPSNEATGTIATNLLAGAMTVASLTATASTTNPQVVNLSWSTPTVPAGVTLQNFAVRRTTVATTPVDSDWTVVTTTVPLNSSDPQTYADSDNRLRGGQTYYYQVALISDAGDQGDWSSTSSGTTTVAAVAPGQLAVPMVTGGYTRITIDWEPLALDGGSDIAGYLVQYSLDGATGWTSLLNDPADTYTVTGVTTTEYTHEGLGDGVTRHYQVRATNGADDGPFSDSASTMTNQRVVINFATGSTTVTLAESADAARHTQTITVERGTDTLGSFDFPFRRAFTGGAVAADFADLTTDANIAILNATDGTFRLTIAGANATFDAMAIDDRNWDPGEGVTYTLDDTHADWPEQFRAGDRNTLTVTVTDNENPPTVSFMVTSAALAEVGGATTATVSAVVDYGAPKGFLQTDHKLVLDLTGSTATPGAAEDFTSTVTEIPLPAGGSQPAVTTVLTVNNDDRDEGQEIINLTGTVQTTASAAVPAVTVTATTVTIVDVLTASVSFDSATPAVEPSTGNAFTVRLSATPTAAFPLTISVGGDLGESEYANLSPAAVTFTANDPMLTRAGTIDITDNDVAELNKTLTLTLALTSGGTLPTGAMIDTTGGSVTVIDADRVTASIGLATLADDTVQAAAVVEGGTFAFEVTLSRAVDAMVTVPWSIELLEPLEDIDFGDMPGTSGNVIFMADAAEANPTATVTLTLAADTDDAEVNEPFTVTLGPATTSDLGDRATVAAPPGNALTGTIVEPDRIGPTVEIAELPARLNGEFTITITFNEDIAFSDFDRSDITVTNGRPRAPVAAPEGQLRTFTVRITPEDAQRRPLDEGDEITVQIAAGDVPDASPRMNLNSPSNIVRTIFDSVAPTPTLSGSHGDRVRDNFILTVDFGEVVENFTAAGIGITQAPEAPEAPVAELMNDFASADGGRTYTVTVDVPDSGEPTITFDIEASAATDIAGNTSEAAESFVVTVDRTAPVPTVSNAPTASITEPSFTIQLDFGEAVTGLATDDFTGDNLTVNSVTPAATPNSYTVNLTVGVSGPVALDLNAGAVMDEAGNMSAAIDDLFTGTATLTVLTVGIADPGVVGAAFIVTVTFGEAVMGFGDAATDISIAPSSAAAGSPVSSTVAGEENRVFTVPVTATVEEELTISIPRDVATATSDGKPNAASVPIMVTPDLTPPVGRVTPDPVGRPVNADFSVTITFDEPVTDFDAGDIGLGGVSEGAAVRNFEAVTAGMNYTADVTLPDNDGTLIFTIAADALTDAVGNSPAADITLGVTVDATPPTVQFVPPTPTGPVNEDFVVGIRFSEPIDADSFDVDRITFKAGRGRRGELTPVVAGREYTLAVFAPAASGPVDITVGAGTVTDAATNPNVEFTGTVIVDNTRPLPELSTDTASPLNQDFVLTIDFGESVTGFTAADITIASEPDTATASLANDFAPTAGGQTYTVTVDVPETDAVLTINVAEDVAEDVLGNQSRAATPLMVIVDRTPPTVTVSNAPVTAVTEPFTVQLEFLETVTGLAPDDFDLTNLVVTDVSPIPNTPMSYTVSLAPIATGPIALDLNADAVRDAAGNGNLLMADLFTGTADVTGLTTFITAPPRVGATFDIIVTFGEAVTGFDGAGDITIAPSTAASASVPVASTAAGEENRVFTVGITATEETELTISIAAGTALAAEDSEPNLASLATVRTPDLTPPSGRITTTRRVVNDAFEIDIAFTEAVTGFAASDISLSRARGARVTGFEAGTPVGEQYSATITLPDADGFVIVTIPAGAVTDGVGLENAAISTSVRVDTTPPVVVRLFSRAPATVVDEFEVEVWLSERVPEFAADDLQVTNGSAEAPVAADFRPIFMVKIVPTVDGTVTVRVPAEAVRDYAGNRNVVPSRDTVLRTAALQPAPARPTGLRAFSEQRAVVLRWTAPALAADGSTGFATRYRIQSSTTGRPGSWGDVVARTTDDATSYRHADLGDNVTMYYRVYAINVSGSSPQPSNVVVAVTPMPVDIDADGRVTADDGLAYLHILLGPPPEPNVRRTLLAPYLPAHIDRDNVSAVDAAIEELIAQRERMRLSLVDVNRDGTQNVIDALLIYYVKGFPELVGDGRAGSGFAPFRRVFIQPYLNLTGSPTAEQIERAINDVIGTVRGL